MRRKAARAPLANPQLPPRPAATPRRRTACSAAARRGGSGPRPWAGACGIALPDGECLVWEAIQDDEFALFKVYYNYERPECGEGNGFLNRRRTGVIRLADSDDIPGNNFDGSDFLLVEVEDEIPSSWDVYYAGWDASGSGASSGVGIHHPSGDVKKVSTFTQNTSSISLGSFGSHWRVYWIDTITNGGASAGG